MLIYIAVNKINGKSYVGQTINSLNKRRNKHNAAASSRCDNMYFHKALRKYGKDNFTWIILHDDITTIDFLNQLEIFYIGFYNTYNNGYNLNAGGNNAIPTEESRRKMSKAHEGVSLSTHHRKQISIANTGRNNPMYGRSGINAPGYGKCGKDSPSAVPILINNRHFDTRKEASEFMNVTPSTIRNRIRHKTKWQDYSYAE